MIMYVATQFFKGKKVLWTFLVIVVKTEVTSTLPALHTAIGDFLYTSYYHLDDITKPVLQSTFISEFDSLGCSDFQL